MGLFPPQGDGPTSEAVILDAIVDAKGDIIAATAADTISRLAVGANDTVLTADSAQATGLKWATAGGTLDAAYTGGQDITVDIADIDLIASGSLDQARTLTLSGTHTMPSAASAEWSALYVRPSVSLSGSTNVTTATGFNMVQLVRPTITDAGTITSITNAATLYIENSPTGSGLTVTNPYSLWVDGGSSRFDGAVLISTGSGIAFDGDTDTGLFHLGADNPYLVGGGASGTGIFITSGSSSGRQILFTTPNASGINTGLTNFTFTAGTQSGTSASTEVIDVDFDLDATLQFSTGAVTANRSVVVRNRTYGFVGASTLTDAATMAIIGAPVAGSNATITRSMALWVQAGTARFDGGVAIGEAASNTETGSTNTLRIANGTAPDNGLTDVVQFYSSDNSAGHTIPSFFCEGTEVLATGQADSASATRVKVRINGTVVTLLAI